MLGIKRNQTKKYINHKIYSIIAKAFLKILDDKIFITFIFF